jgi:membrane protease YdiL (CAAX protease family)
VEYPFYLVPAFPDLRDRLAGARLPIFLLSAAVLPYVVCCLGAVRFEWVSLVRLIALALATSLWYVVLPAVPIVDLAFLALISSVLLGKYFDGIYAPLHPEFRDLKDVFVVGHLSLIVMAAMALMVGRRVPETGYGFLPSWREWRIGAIHYLYFVVVGFPLALAIKATHLLAAPRPVWFVAATFLGVLWVVALSEEFGFRGLLQRWVEEWTWSRQSALLITSVIFGLVHLGFRDFPNWRWALVVAVLGWFCGHARNQAGSIRASMVTHALAVTTWRAFFA